jgi:hypothetical protein
MTGVDERALAKQIEDMKDDPEAWGDASEPPGGRKSRSERRQRAAVVSVRFTAEELATAQAYADQRGLSLSGALRTVLLEAATPPPVATPRRWSWLKTSGGSASNATPRVRSTGVRFREPNQAVPA